MEWISNIIGILTLAGLAIGYIVHFAKDSFIQQRLLKRMTRVERHLGIEENGD